MQLNELQIGDRFEFGSRHRGHMFEVTSKTNHSLTYVDLATKEERTTTSIRKAFTMYVHLLNTHKSVDLTKQQHDLLIKVLHQAYQLANEEQDLELRSEIDKLYVKIK